ncbi:hypothetical protein BZA77DRAFT_305189 [Pyronema omphalodes]|nr:hypothetical protein BZA77DRAFT_305189 [Pyronema omphalodes]
MRKAYRTRMLIYLDVLHRVSAGPYTFTVVIFYDFSYTRYDREVHPISCFASTRKRNFNPLCSFGPALHNYFIISSMYLLPHPRPLLQIVPVLYIHPAIRVHPHSFHYFNPQPPNVVPELKHS